MTRNLLVLGLGALFIGCDTADTADDTSTPDDTTVDTAPLDTEINQVSYGFDETEWVYGVELIGWGAGVDIDIYQNEGGYVWEESHVLDQLDYDPNGEWDKWGTSLPIVTDWKDQVDSVNTLYTGAMEDTLTWMVTAYDMDGYFADCAVWGKTISYYASFGCWEVQF